MIIVYNFDFCKSKHENNVVNYKIQDVTLNYIYFY